MTQFNSITIKNTDFTYTLSNNEKKFLVVSGIGNKKTDLIEKFHKFLGVDCPDFPPADDIRKDMITNIIEPLENNKPFIFSATLFFRFGKWATFQTNFHTCRGIPANRILTDILGISISRGDISNKSQIGYVPITTEKMFSNVLNKIITNKSLNIEFKK